MQLLSSCCCSEKRKENAVFKIIYFLWKYSVCMVLYLGPVYLDCLWVINHTSYFLFWLKRIIQTGFFTLSVLYTDIFTLRALFLAESGATWLAFSLSFKLCETTMDFASYMVANVSREKLGTQSKMKLGIARGRGSGLRSKWYLFFSPSCFEIWAKLTA